MGLVFFGTLNVHGTCMGAHTACMHQLCVIVFFFSLEGVSWLYVSIFWDCKRTWDLYGCPYSFYASIMCYSVFCFHLKVCLGCMCVFLGL